MTDDGAPARIRIEHDDHHAEWVGRARGGRQFFLTRPFVPADEPGTGREFVALYLWDAEGVFLEARIDDLGPRSTLDDDRDREVLRKRLQEVGPHQRTRIEVAPFQIERFGVLFGLVPRPPESEEEDWTVTAEPGDYMAFTPPWNGEYDT